MSLKSYWRLFFPELPKERSSLSRPKLHDLILSSDEICDGCEHYRARILLAAQPDLTAEAEAFEKRKQKILKYKF